MTPTHRFQMVYILLILHNRHIQLGTKRGPLTTPLWPFDYFISRLIGKVIGDSNRQCQHCFFPVLLYDTHYQLNFKQTVKAEERKRRSLLVLTHLNSKLYRSNIGNVKVQLCGQFVCRMTTHTDTHARGWFHLPIDSQCVSKHNDTPSRAVNRGAASK